MLKYVQVDVFTRTRFKGNPAAVFILSHAIPDELMQNIALELNLSESAFVRRRDDGEFSLRWFTPQCEVDLCGHATLASAYALWSEGYVPHAQKIVFHTRSGAIPVTKRESHICMDLPLISVEPLQPNESSHAPLHQGKPCLFLGRSAQGEFLIELASEAEVRAYQPDLQQLKILNSGLIITALSDDSRRDFVCRYFAPNVGIDEDPVTGYAHCHLAWYWQKKLSRSQMVSEQISKRGGVVHMLVQSDSIVEIAGHAVTCLKGIVV